MSNFLGSVQIKWTRVHYQPSPGGGVLPVRLPRIYNIDEAAGRRRHLSDQQFVPPGYRGHGSGQNGHDVRITGHARPEYASISIVDMN